MKRSDRSAGEIRKWAPAPLRIACCTVLVVASSCPQQSSPGIAQTEVAGLLRSIARAQVELDYQGVRKHAQVDSDVGEHLATEFVERVFHRGDRGEARPERHLVELQKLDSGSATPAHWQKGPFEELRLTHRLRSPFIERYREVRLGSAESILANYSVTVGQGERILDRECLYLECVPRARSHPSGLGRGKYQIWVDAESKLPLRTREFAYDLASQPMVAESEFIELGPLLDEASIEWPFFEVSRTRVAPNELPAFLEGRDVGFPPEVQSFELVRREEIHAPGVGSFLLHYCSDGLEPLLFLQGLPESPAHLESTANPSPSGEIALEILVVEFGRTLALTTTHDGVSTYLIGKGEQDALRLIFQQLFGS